MTHVYRAASPSAINWNAVILLMVISIIWGGSFPLIKIAVAEIPPITLATGRISMAALVLISVAIIGRINVFLSREVIYKLIKIAVVSYALPFLLALVERATHIKHRSCHTDRDDPDFHSPVCLQKNLSGLAKDCNRSLRTARILRCGHLHRTIGLAGVQRHVHW